jgi:hypothetical protein
MIFFLTILFKKIAYYRVATGMISGSRNLKGVNASKTDLSYLLLISLTAAAGTEIAALW